MIIFYSYEYENHSSNNDLNNDNITNNSENGEVTIEESSNPTPKKRRLLKILKKKSNDHNNNDQCLLNKEIILVPVNKSADNPIFTRWKNIGNVKNDPASRLHRDSTVFHYPFDLENNIRDKVFNPLDYFEMMFPVEYIREICRHTNNCLKQAAASYVLNKKELYNFLGIRLAMAVLPMYGKSKEYFEDPDSDQLQFGINFTKSYGYTYTKFRNINSCFRLSEFKNEIDEVCYIKLMLILPVYV